MVGVAREDHLLVDSAPAKDLAVNSPRLEDELDLALVEAQQREHARQFDERRQRLGRGVDGTRLGRARLADQCLGLCQRNHYIDQCLINQWRPTVTWATP